MRSRALWKWGKGARETQTWKRNSAGGLATYKSECFPLIKTTETHLENRNEACGNYIGLGRGMGEGALHSRALWKWGKVGARDTDLEKKLCWGEEIGRMHERMLSSDQDH